MTFHRKPLGLKGAPPAGRPDYLEAVHQLPCIICWSFGEIQDTPTTAHHPICGRYSQAKAPDICAIPLCHRHHQGHDLGDCSIHFHRAEWVRRYGPDTDYIAVTQDRLSHLMKGKDQ